MAFIHNPRKLSGRWFGKKAPLEACVFWRNLPSEAPPFLPEPSDSATTGCVKRPKTSAEEPWMHFERFEAAPRPKKSDWRARAGDARRRLPASRQALARVTTPEIVRCKRQKHARVPPGSWGAGPGSRRAVSSGDAKAWRELGCSPFGQNGSSRAFSPQNLNNFVGNLGAAL